MGSITEKKETSETPHGQVPARIIGPGEGDTLAAGPVEIEYKLRGSDGAGFAMLEYRVPAGFAAPPRPHWHTREHAFFYVLEGELTLGLGEEVRQAPAGTFVHLPPGSPFVWSNPHSEGARFLAMWAPGGFEEFFGEVAAAVGERGGPPTPEAMGEIIPPLWEKYGIVAE